MPRGDLSIVHADRDGRIVVTDSVTFCDERLSDADVLVAGSFAGAVSLDLALPFGVRALIAHAAGVGKDQAGISGLGRADRLGVPAAAVDTLSARLGDGRNVFEEGVIGYVNETARGLGVRVGMRAHDAATLLLKAPPGRALSSALVDRNQRVVAETPAGRVVLVTSLSFTDATNRRDVLCAGSHGGRVNAQTLLSLVHPRGIIVNDGGRGKDNAGVDGLPLLDAAGIPAAAVDTMSARIGDPASTYETGAISALNEAVRAAGVKVGQTAKEAARLILSRTRGSYEASRRPERNSNNS